MLRHAHNDVFISSATLPWQERAAARLLHRDAAMPTPKASPRAR